MITPGRPRSIKIFEMDMLVGDDKYLAETQPKLIKLVDQMMRESGCVPVLDLNPVSTTDYNPDRDNYTITVYMYGSYVGRVKAWEYQGIADNRLLPFTTPNHKS